jgi:hypothetical protein
MNCLSRSIRAADFQVLHQPGAEAPSEEEKRIVPRHDSYQRNRNRHWVLRDSAMNQKAAGQQRDLLRQRQSQSTQNQDHQQTQIGEMLYVTRDEAGQALAPMSKSLPQSLANLIRRQPTVGHLACRHGLTNACVASGAMVAAEAIEQALVSLMLLASAGAMKLREQFGMLLRDQVGLARVTREQVWIERQPARHSDRIRRCPYLVDGDTDESYKRDDERRYD